jgi:ribose transport system ATP-binding protein
MSSFMSEDPRPPLLEVQRISKAFPGVQALQDVDVSLQHGEVLAVIGENGAGKSTLMKILAGVQTPDAGRIRVDGREVTIRSVSDALRLGIALIHQELNLADNLDVAANIFLGREPTRWGWIQRSRLHADAQRYLDQLGLRISSHKRLSRLSIGQQQLIEIAKALSVNARVLIMDEPTSSLSQGESAQLFEVIDDLRRRGVSVIYISHRLREVKRLADRVVVLRDGANAGQLARSEISHDAMVRLMVGRDIAQFYARGTHAAGDTVLEIRDLVTRSWPQHRVSFLVRRGEIVGMAGLVGAGRTELLRAIFGVDPPLSGAILLDGKPLPEARTDRCIAAGLALVPEDRKQHGLVLEMSVRANIGLPGLARHRRPGGLLNRRREARDAAQMIEQLRIKTPSPEQFVGLLSGGNQQKTVIGKWLSLSPRVLLLDEPTRGIDVGAKEEIYRLIERLAQQGVGILFASSELEEILGMSDRVLVMHEGRLAGQLTRSQMSEEAIMHLATGGQDTAAAPTGQPAALQRTDRP